MTGDLPLPLRLESLGDSRFRAPNAGDPDDRDVVFGGQMLAQAVMAAALTSDKRVKSISAIFARSAAVSGAPLELDVEPFHDGRALASLTITVSQGTRRCARLLVLLTIVEPDLIRHGVAMPLVPGPDEAIDAEAKLTIPGAEVRAVGDAESMWTSDAPASGPEALLWTRLPGGPKDPAASQAVLAWATDGFLIGTAMRRHGMGYDLSHRTISTGVVTHSITFHEQFESGEWLLIANESPYAGHGRCYGRGNVFAADGRHVASFSQDSIIRRFPDARTHEDEARTIF